MKIDVKLFAILRERAGAAGLALELPAGSSAAAAGAALVERFPALRDYLPSVAYAVNRDYVAPAHVLHDGDELALIPPVSGG